MSGSHGPGTWRTTIAGVALASLMVGTGGATAATAQTSDWTDVFGARATADVVGAIATGADGSLVVAGSTTGRLAGLARIGGRDAFLRSYDLDGTVRWTRQSGTRKDDLATGVAVTATGVIFVVGRTDGPLGRRTSLGGTDAFVQRWSASGQLVWTRLIGGADRDWATAVAVDATGVTVVGTTEGALPGRLALGDRDGFVQRLSLRGAVLWTRQLGTPQEEQLTAVTIDGTGGVVVTGETSGRMTGRAMGREDAFVRAYSARGALRWTRQLGTAEGDHAAALTPGPGDGTYLVGTTGGTFRGQTAAGDLDGFLVELTSAGAITRLTQFGSSGADWANGVAVDSLGFIFIAGQTMGVMAGGANLGIADAYLRAMNEDGTERWTTQDGTAGLDGANGVAVDADGNIYVGGSQGALAPGTGDAVVTRYRADR